MLAEVLVNQVMDTEADQSSGGRSRQQERLPQAEAPGPRGRNHYAHPGGFFPEDNVARYQKNDRALVAAVADLANRQQSPPRRQRPLRAQF